MVTTFAGSGCGGFCDGLASSARFYGPYGVSVDQDRNEVYISDTLNNRIRKVTSITKERYRQIMAKRLRDSYEEREVARDVDAFMQTTTNQIDLQGEEISLDDDEG